MRITNTLLAPAAAVGLVVGLAAVPAAAQARPPIPEPTANPWQMRHWPQTQPWQLDAAGPAHLRGRARPRPIDPQNYELPDTMTWADYKPVPGTTWADPARKGSMQELQRRARPARLPEPAVRGDPAQELDRLRQPDAGVNDVPRDQVARVLQGLPQHARTTLNRGHTIHEYWMEDSGGRYGVEPDRLRPVPDAREGPRVRHGEFQGGHRCPAGDTCDRDIRTDGRAAWVADVGEDDAPREFDFVFYPQRRARTSRPPGRSSGR